MLLQTPIVNPLIPDLAGKGTADAPAVLGKIFAGIIGLLLIVGTMWSLIQLLLGGFNWISSGGDKGKIEAARDRITNALLGLVIMFAAWAFFLVILQFLGIAGGSGSSIDFILPKLF